MLRIVKAMRNPKRLLMYSMTNFKVFRILPDRLFLKIEFKLRTGSKLNIDSPKSFNEKLQWLKLYDRRPEYTMMVDKYEVRKFVARKIGEKYLIPLLGVYNSFDEIDFSKLPDQFVLKPNHTSGNVFICKDKSKIDYALLRKKVNAWMKRRYYWVHREWPYKDVKPRIVCEKYMVDESGEELKDYKIYCFDGEPKLVQVDFSRFEGHKRNIYDLDWNLVDFTMQYPRDPNKRIPVPNTLNNMLRIAGQLSKGIPHLRVDFYSIGDELYFGELTFFPEAGFVNFDPLDYDLLMGSWITLKRRLKPDQKS